MITDKTGRSHFVIDQHVHVGLRPTRSTTASASYLPDELIANMDANGVDMVVGFPKANPHTDYRIEDERIIASMKEHPTRIVAFARINPYFGAKAVADIRDYATMGARGLKIHPIRDFSGNRVNDPDLMFPIIDAAQQANLLVLIHSGEWWNCSPSLIADLARNFPKTNFVMAHSAGFGGHQEAIAVARHQDNFFFSSRRRHTTLVSDWSSDVCSSDLTRALLAFVDHRGRLAAGEEQSVTKVGRYREDAAHRGARDEREQRSRSIALRVVPLSDH